MELDYRISLSELTEGEKEALNRVIPELDEYQVNRRTIIFLMQEMNRMFGRTIYTEKDLFCPDCLSRIKNFWKNWKNS